MLNINPSFSSKNPRSKCIGGSIPNDCDIDIIGIWSLNSVPSKFPSNAPTAKTTIKNKRLYLPFNADTPNQNELLY